MITVFNDKARREFLIIDKNKEALSKKEVQLIAKNNNIIDFKTEVSESFIPIRGKKEPVVHLEFSYRKYVLKY